MNTIMDSNSPQQDVVLPAATTDGQRNVQKRVAAFQHEHDLAKRELALVKQDIEALQIERDRYRGLLLRVLDADANCTGDVYVALIADVKAALEVEA